MDRRPCGNHEFVVDADAFDLAADGAAGRIQRECLDAGLRIRSVCPAWDTAATCSIRERRGADVLGGLSSFSAWFFCNRSMFSRPSFTSSTMEPHASATRVASRSRESAPWSGGEENQPVAAIARFGAVVCDVVRAPRRRRCGDSSSREYQYSGGRTTSRRALSSGTSPCGVKIWTPSKNAALPTELLERLGDLAAHFGLVVETALAVLHLAAQVGAGVEPEPRRVLRLVAGAVEVVQPVGEPIQGVGVDRGCLARLKAAQQDARAVQAANPGFGRDR